MRITDLFEAKTATIPYYRREVKVWVNPSRSEILQLGTQHALRGLADMNRLFVWEAGSMTHAGAHQALWEAGLLNTSTVERDGKTIANNRDPNIMDCYIGGAGDVPPEWDSYGIKYVSMGRPSVFLNPATMDRIHECPQMQRLLYGYEVFHRVKQRRAVTESATRAPVYHAMAIEYATMALTNNELLATSTQRFWGDGKRRLDNDPQYRSSYWMKGISLTRDLRYALQWNSVIFILDLEYIQSKTKVVPFAWNASLGKNANHKREREEFAILKRTPDTYMRDEEEGGGMDTNRFLGPEGSLPDLNKYLKGILMQARLKDEARHREEVNEIASHPRFLGFVDPTGKLI